MSSLPSVRVLCLHIQGDPKRCVPIKISIVTLIKKLFISNYNHTLFSLWKTIHQSFSYFCQFLVNYGFPKMCSKCPSFRCKQICTRLAKLSITFTHSSFGMAFIFAVMAVFNSLIVCGFPWYTLSLRKPHR